MFLRRRTGQLIITICGEISKSNNVIHPPVGAFRNWCVSVRSGLILCGSENQFSIASCRRAPSGGRANQIVVLNSRRCLVVNRAGQLELVNAVTQCIRCDSMSDQLGTSCERNPPKASYCNSQGPAHTSYWCVTAREYDVRGKTKSATW